MSIVHLTRLGISTFFFGTLCTACIIIGDSKDPDDGTSGGDVDVATCGDGLVQAGEDCDRGKENNDTRACTTKCKSAACGDGLVQDKIEMCDDANKANGDGCNNNCIVSGTPQWTQGYNGAANGEDAWNAVALDATGANIYVAGREASATQGTNAVVRKYDETGKVLWTQSYNGAANLDDQVIGVTVDAKGQVIAIGEESNPDKTTDIWVRKYSSAGETVWTQKLNGGAAGFSNSGYEVATNAAGDLFIAAGVQTVGIQGRNVYVAKLASATGAVVWADSLDGPGSSDDEAFSVTVDASGNILAAGYISTAKGADVWVRKYKDNGPDYSILWTQTYNDTSNEADYAFSVATDLQGNVLVSGAETKVDKQLNAWIRKYDADGNMVWTQEYKSASGLNTAGSGIAVDSSDNVIVTGYTTLTGATTDIWVRKYSPAGALLWNQNYNNDKANGDDAANDVAVDPKGYIYVAGSEKAASPALDGWLRKLEP
jgi:cysteine-rich repeat protein